ncbi:MAG: hypothetical protein ABW221_05050 [Vicinamibacteria bacterium]
MSALCALVVLASGAGAASIDTAPYVRAHLDHVRPEHMASFAEARREWKDFLAPRGLPDAWGGTVLEVEGRGFYSLRPLPTLDALVAPRPPAPTDEAYAAAQRRYNQRSDAVLVFPHATQVWSRDDDLSYRPAAGPATLAAACSGTLAFDSVEPLAWAAYEQAWTRVHDALRRVAYPLTHVVWGSRYGDGRTVSIWIGASAEAFHAAPLEPALVQAVGAPAAAELTSALRAATKASDVARLTCRPDLGN